MHCVCTILGLCPVSEYCRQENVHRFCILWLVVHVFPIFGSFFALFIVLVFFFLFSVLQLFICFVNYASIFFLLEHF